MPVSAAAAGSARALPPVAARVDAELARMDGEVDWLLALSPIHNDALWVGFEESGRTRIPPLRYIDLDTDLHAVRERLLALPVEDIESPLLSGLLAEKQRELDRQIELVRLRDTDGFINASLDLFGGVEPRLLELANRILGTVGPSVPLEAEAGIDEVLEAVEDELDWYRERSPDFTAEVVVDADLNSLMMVSHGRFYIDGDVRLPRARVQPLIQHEIGTHLVTRHNGSRQSLQQLRVGLAHYDPLQEGLGVLGEFLAGYLPGERLRVLAARVVATEMAIHREEVPAIFDLLHNTHGIPTDDAFDVAVRARRGGGLTKDAVYLSGLRDLVEYLAGGGEFEPLFTGKFALSHRVVLDQLVEEGWAVAPDLLPRYCSAPDAAERLARCRQTPVERLFHTEPDNVARAPAPEETA
ncbi:tyrosine/phenylalanine carboxypeptidase domain-containing protein [Novilysobacter arseniciresistens]|uniref:tyrosine/phenylalanine carboxypeptidase domain-containing protein n=1 Tax=Novilysobacter arseniciresistens TaxID=1385522 RepID=UPI00068C3E41|nr:tyrosine/phenylalanine carboxypeptidase domain-containing protein [Lysobacter arseniciresistens]